MENKQFFIGERIKVDGDYYNVVGKITYRNKIDGNAWDEYRLMAVNYANTERWLAVDNIFQEYSLSKVNPQASTFGYHVVDSGVAQVVAVAGDVDVEVGEQADFEEYEDSTEEKIISVEHWVDGVEVTSGYYLDPWEFGREGENVRSSGKGNQKAVGIGVIAFVLIWCLGFIGPFISGIFSGNKKIESYLKKSSLYEYASSITGEDKQRANIYRYVTTTEINDDNEADFLMHVAKSIIDNVNGNSDAIQQNDEKDDKTVAILTKKEYCIIYRGEDDNVYVQVSSRKYAYTSDRDPYRSRRRTRRYYRRFYYSLGYNQDSSSYSSSRSAYSNYSDGTIEYNSGNDLNSYSNSVRQSSAGSRSSDGGGLSSGK